MHATVAGVLLGLSLPVRTRTRDGVAEEHSVGERIEHAVRPLSAGFAVPVFALFAAGVGIGAGGLSEAVADRAFTAVVVALVVGKCAGVMLGAWATARFTRAELDDELDLGRRARPVAPGGDRVHRLAAHRRPRLRQPAAHATTTSRSRSWSGRSRPPCSPPSCSGSATACTGGICEEESRDDDHDGIPDVYQRVG